MGYEYRLHVAPMIEDLPAACDAVFAATHWESIATSFVDVPAGVGVRSTALPDDPKWPTVADLYVEGPGIVFVVCHNHDGGQFMNALVDSLRAAGHRVTVDDDV